jgi:glycosyltransferase involved in cell wall biosynthesis
MSDVCIIVEGSYPYVAGGVASWVNQIIEKMPDITFEIVALLATKKDIVEYRYPIHKNITNIQHIFLQDGCKKPLFMPDKISIQKEIEHFLDNYFSIGEFENLVKLFFSIKDKKKLKEELVYSKYIYDRIEEFFISNNLVRKSFLDFFWSIRALYLGTSNTILATPPKAKIYHTVSTGYAGLYAALCKILYPDSKMILTEHGIYTRERNMEIVISDWPDRDKNAYIPERVSSFYQMLWMGAFANMSKVCYNYADAIYSLHEKNNSIQIAEGANPKIVHTIRNGIDVDKFSFIHKQSVSKPIKIGFLGRVVKIKDVKTLIRAAAIVISKYQACLFLIAGPYDEDKDYFDDCIRLAQMLEIDDHIQFLGKMNSRDFCADIDILVMTSLSEGQPLVISEANASGTPAIATDVGGCKEMIDGGKDDLFGPAGIITPSGAPETTANAIIKLIEDKDFYANCSINGRKRTEIYYNEKNLIDSYKNVYLNLMNS